MSYSKVILLGRLGQDPELKQMPNGTSVCNFSIATSKTWTDKNGQKQEKVNWHNIVVFSKLAELCGQYLSKGREALIDGELENRSWDDKDGNKKYITEIRANSVHFIGSNNNQQNDEDKQAAKDDLGF